MSTHMYEKLTKGVYIIAEMSANHAGDLENALDIVRQAARIGVDCVKIQTYTADTMTLDSNRPEFRIEGGLWDGYNLYQLYQEAATPWEWHQAIQEECHQCGVDFLSTPFDKSSVDFLESLKIQYYKIASFEFTDIPLIEYVASKKKPMVMSCGMATQEEINEALDACKRMGNNEIVLLKCCSSYPADYQDMNLVTIQDMQKRFGVPVGLSDHSAGSIGAIVGVANGACIIEKHICLSRKIKNPDSEFSMEIEEFESMIQDIRNAKKICGNVSYDRTEKEQASTQFRRSLFAKKDIQVGEIITEDNICIRRPSVGLEPKYYKEIIGKVAKNPIAYAAGIQYEDLQ